MMGFEIVICITNPKSGNHETNWTHPDGHCLLAFPIFSQNVTIPDTAFLDALIEEGVDTNEDSLISYAEAEAILSLNVSERGIHDMTGIEAFVNLGILDCGSNELTSLNVSNAALTELSCFGNQLSSLDVSGCTALVRLVLNEMSSLTVVCVWTTPFPPTGVFPDITGSPNVEFNDCSGTGIEKYEESGISLYPIPTDDLLTLETEYPDHYSTNITTLNGQQILAGEMEGSFHQLDLSSFRKGIYFITIKSTDFVSTRKIIKL
jgi:hypothetical protein